MANSTEKTLVLKLVGLASYNQPKHFNRIIYRGDVVPGIPESFAGSEDDANTLLGMGVRNVEGDLIRPTWKDVTAEFERTQRPVRKAAAPEPEDGEPEDEEPEEDEDALDEPDETPASTPVEPKAAKAPKTTSQRTAAARKTTASKTK